MFVQDLQKKLKNFISKNQDDRDLTIVIIIFSIITGLIVLTFPDVPGFSVRPVVIGITIINFFALLLAFLGILEPAKIILSVAGFVAITLLIFISGIHDDSIGGFYVLLILTTLFFGRKGLLIFGLLNTMAILGIGLAETSGRITTLFGPLTKVYTVFTAALFMILASLALYFFFKNRLSNMVTIARRNEQKLIETNRELVELETILEQRVESRTSELKTTNKKLKTKLTQIRKLQAKIIEEAIRDPLTGLYNRRFMNETLSLEIARAKRMNFPITIFFIDIDHFKDFNDKYGHQVGDEILREIGKVLSTGLRAGDIACRYGGEEFLMVLPGMPKEKAKINAERIKDRISNMAIPNLDDQAKITVSIGIAVFPQDATTIGEPILLADQALYLAKNKGRDRVEMIDQEK